MVGGSGCGQLKSVGGMCCVQLCGNLKLLILNSADNLGLMTGWWESGSGLLQALLPAGPNFPDPSVQNILT